MFTLKNYVEWKLTHADKIKEVKSYPLVLEKCKRGKKIKELLVYGNCFQNGTPTPENPLEIQSVGELVTDKNDINFGKYRVSIVQKDYNTDSGLCEEQRTFDIYIGEPLRRFGSCADYIDFKSGKVIRRMYEEVFKGTEKWTLINVVENAAGFRFDLRDGGGIMVSINVADNGMCNKYPVVRARSDKTCSGGASLNQIVDFIDSSFTTVDEWNAHLASEYAKGTPLKFLHTLAIPKVETIECTMPKLTGKTTVFEVDTSILPEYLYGKYIEI